MASTEIRVNLLFEDNISAVTRRIGSLTKAINRLNSALGQLRSNNETTIRVELEGAEGVLRRLREINRMLNRLKNNQEVRIRLTLDEREVQRAQRTVINNIQRAVSMRLQQSWQQTIRMQQTVRVINQNYVAVVNTGERHTGNILITQGRIDYRQPRARRGETERGFGGGSIGSFFTGAANFGVSYAISGIRFFGSQLPRMVVGFAANYFKTLVDYQKRAYSWMVNVAKQGIDFLRNNVIEGLKKGVQIIANVGKFLIQVPFKYIGGALVRGITGFYSGAIKLFTGMLQAPFKVLRAAGSIFNEIDRWFRHVSQAFYYVSMTASYISRTAGLIAGILVTAIMKIFETFKTAVQSQYRIAVTTGIVATPTGIGALQGNYAADIRNKMTLLTKVAYQINQRTGAAFDDVVNLLYFISSSGFKQTEELKNVTEAVSSIAFATGSEPIALFRSLISVMGAEGIEPTEKNLGATLAKIVYAVSEGVFEMGELATQLQRVAAFSEAANTSFEETLSIMAALSKGGLKPEMIGTGLSQVFVQLNKPQVQEKMRQYMGIVPVKFEEGIMQQQSIMEIIESMIPSDLLKRVKSGELTPADREMLKQIAKQSAIMMRFEKRAQTAWLTLFNKLDDVYRMLHEFEGMAEVPELLEKYLAYFKEIPSSTVLATLNRLTGAVEYLKTTVLNALMNKLSANIETIEKWFRNVAGKIASLIENGDILQRIAELIKSIIKLIIDLIRVAIIFGVIATTIRLMAAFFEMIRPNVLLLIGFVKGFKDALAKQGKGDLSNLVENYVELMLTVGEKLGEFFAKLFEVIENFVNNVNKYKELTGSSGEAVGQATAEVIVNLSGILADATGIAIKWVNDFTAAFLSEFNRQKEKLTTNVQNILLNIFAFDLDFFNIALKLVEGFVGGLNKALKISWTVTHAVIDVEQIRKSYNATALKSGKPKKKLLSELDTNAEIDEYVEDVRKQTIERLIKNGFYKTQDEIDDATKQAIANFAKSYVLFVKEIPNTVKNVIVDGIEASVFGLDVGLKLLIKILDGMISGLNTIVDKLLKGEYNEILQDIQSDTAQFITKLGAVFMDVAIIGFTVASELMAGAFKGVEALDKWFESSETRKMRTALANAIKKFFVNSLKFAISGVEFVGEVLNTILPALSEGLDEIVRYLENPSVSKELEETLTKVMTNVVIFAGKTIKLMLTAFPIFAKAFTAAMTGKGMDQFKKDVMSKWDGVIKALRDYLPTAISGFIDILVFALTLVDDVIVQFENALAKNQEKMVILFTKIFEVMFDIVKTKAEVLKAAAKGFAEVLKNALIPDTVQFKKFQEFKGTVEEIGKTFGESTANLFAAFIEVGGALIKGIAEGLRKADSSVIAKALGDIFKDAVSSSISFMSFGLDVAKELLIKIYNWLNVVLELFRVLRDSNAWEQFKETRKLEIQVAYSQSKEQIEFSEDDIKGLENIKTRLGELKLIVPGLMIALGDVWWNIVSQVTTQIKELFAALSLYKPDKSYSEQLPEFQKYIKEQDFKNFQDMVANVTQSLSNALSVLLSSGPIMITKLTFKALQFAFENADDKTRTDIIAALAAAITGEVIKVTTGNNALAMTVAVSVFFVVREVANFIIEHYDDVKKGITYGLKTALNGLGIVGLSFALASNPGVAMILTIGSALSFAAAEVLGVSADSNAFSNIGDVTANAIVNAFPAIAGLIATVASGGNALIGFTVTAALEFTLKFLKDLIKTEGLQRFVDAFVAFLKNAFVLALGGGLIGFVVGGAPGALVGLTIGLAVSFVLNIEDNLNKAKKQIEEEMKKVESVLKAGVETAKSVSGQYSANANFFQEVASQMLSPEKAKKDARYGDIQPLVNAFYKDMLPKYLQNATNFYLARSDKKSIPAEIAKWYAGFVTQNPKEFEQVSKMVDLWYQTDITKPYLPEEVVDLKGEIPDWFAKKLETIASGNFKSSDIDEFIKAAQIYLEFIPYYVIMKKLKGVKPEERATVLEKYLNDANGFVKDVNTAVENYKRFLKMLVNTKIVANPKLRPDQVFDIQRKLSYTIDALQFKYAKGGYTGDGGKYEPAGIVHKGEYVIPQWMVKKYPDVVATLEKVRKRGYQPGGAVEFTVPLIGNSGQRTVSDAFLELTEAADKVVTTISEATEKVDIDAILNMLSDKATTKDIARGFGEIGGLLGQLSKGVLGLTKDGLDGLKDVSSGLDEIKRQVFGIKETLQNAPQTTTTTTTTTASGKKITEITGDIKATLINALANIFLGQEAGSVFSSLIMPFFKDLQGSVLEHTVETQDEIKKYKFTGYGIPLLGEIADILLSFGNWADKLVSDEALKEYRSMYIYPEKPGGIKGGEGKFESIGDKLIGFLNWLQNIRPFGLIENIPLIGTPFAAFDNVLGMIAQRMPGIVKNLITFVGSLESVQRAFSPVNEIIKAATEVLTPFINDAMQPLIEVWQMIGRYIGMALIPIVQIFGALLKTLMVIFAPVVDMFRLVGKVIFIVGKVILWVFTKVANAIIDTFNFVINAINSVLGWLGIRLSTLQRLQEESWEDILRQADELFASTTLGASTGGSGGVGVTSKAENITYNNYITVNFEDMVIADKEELKQLIIEALNELSLTIGR